MKLWCPWSELFLMIIFWLSWLFPIVGFLTGFLNFFVSYCFWFSLSAFLLTVFQSCSWNSRVICRTEWFRQGFLLESWVFKALGFKMFNPQNMFLLNNITTILITTSCILWLAQPHNVWTTECTQKKSLSKIQFELPYYDTEFKWYLSWTIFI